MEKTRGSEQKPTTKQWDLAELRKLADEIKKMTEQEEQSMPYAERGTES